MVRSRSQKASYNIISSAITEVLALASTMILPRLVLTHYGSAYNGIASSVSQFLSMISVLTLGVTAATRVALYKTLAAGDTAGTSAIVRATERYMRRVGMVLLVYILGLAALYPLIVKTGFSYLDVALLIIIIGANSFSEYFFGITYRTLLLADQRVYISNIFTSISTVFSIITAVVLIKLGCSYQIVKAGSAAVHIAKIVFQNIYITHHYKLDKRCAPDLSALKRRGDAMAHALANIVHDHTDIVVLTLFADVKTVSVYTVYNIVMNALKKLQLVFNTGTEPIFGNMWVKGEIDNIKKTLGFYEFAVAMFCSAVFSTALVMVLPFVRLYTRGVTDVEYIRPAYALVITAAYAIQSFRVPYLCVVHGIGHYKQTKRAAFYEAGINLGLSVILVNIIGMVGVAIGTLAANLYRTLQYAFYLERNVIPRGKRVFLGKMLWAFFNISLITVPALLYTKDRFFGGWWNWILCSALVFAVSVGVTVLSSLVFYRKDFRNACRILMGMAKKTFRR